MRFLISGGRVRTPEWIRTPSIKQAVELASSDPRRVQFLDWIPPRGTKDPVIRWERRPSGRWVQVD